MKSIAPPVQRVVSIAVLLAGAALALLGPKVQTITLHWPAIVKDGLTLFFSIIIEALPFVLLGSLVSAGIRRWVTPERLQAVMPKSAFLALPLTALLGVFFPVCECGNLPVARQMMRAGMRPAQAVTLLLAAPILNPRRYHLHLGGLPFSPKSARRQTWAGIPHFCRRRGILHAAG
jgi:uncharacterized membrane protein YraQ (UPF0718 family)